MKKNLLITLISVAILAGILFSTNPSYQDHIDQSSDLEIIFRKSEYSNYYFFSTLKRPDKTAGAAKIVIEKGEMVSFGILNQVIVIN